MGETSEKGYFYRKFRPDTLSKPIFRVLTLENNV